jgi:hypothetical protein
MSSSNGLVGFAFELLPTLGPEPCLVRWYCDVWTKNDLSLTLDHLDLRSRLIQAEVTPDRGWDGDHAPALDGDEGLFFAHADSVAALPYYRITADRDRDHTRPTTGPSMIGERFVLWDPRSTANALVIGRCVVSGTGFGGSRARYVRDRSGAFVA